MMTDTAPQAHSGDATTLSAPYSPSWFDRFLSWVEKLPGPSWAFYLAVVAALLAYIHAILVANQKVDLFGPDPRRLWLALLVPYGVWGVSRLDMLARRAVRGVRPLLKDDDAAVALMEYEMTHMPARPVLVMTVIGVAGALAYFAFVPPDVVRAYGPSLQVNFAQLGWLLALTMIVGFIVVYHTYRQLRLVSDALARAEHPDLFNPEPLYAFAQLTGETAVMFMATVLVLVLLGSEQVLNSAVGAAIVGVFFSGSVACFVLPLRGAHERLVATKNRQMADANQRFTRAIADLHDGMDSNAKHDMAAVHATLAGLAIERDAIDNAPTWPWARGTLTGVVTALLLPVVIWLATWLLEKMLGGS